MTKSKFKKLPKRAKKAAFASMGETHSLWKRKVTYGKRNKRSGKSRY